jgi:hypothetical protein
VVARRAKKRKNSSSAQHYDQIRFRFRTAWVNSSGVDNERRRQLYPNYRTSRGNAAAADSGHNRPPALQKKIGDHRAGWTGIRWSPRNQNGRLACGQADYFDRELPKNGDVPRSPLPENGSPMPSAARF